VGWLGLDDCSLPLGCGGTGLDAVGHRLDAVATGLGAAAAGLGACAAFGRLRPGPAFFASAAQRPNDSARCLVGAIDSQHQLGFMLGFVTSAGACLFDPRPHAA